MLNAMLNLFRDNHNRSANKNAPQFVPSSLVMQAPSPANPKPTIAEALQSSKAPSDKFQVQYDSNLIATLEAEHRGMLALYGDIDNAVTTEQWNKVPELLLQFRSALTDHLLKEGVKLYAYLGKALNSEDELAFVFQSFKKEMGVIGKVVFSFVDRYTAERALLDAEQRAAFTSEFKTICPVLVSRIQREETQLYSIYRNLH